MSWLLLSIVAYFLTAIVTVVDKFLLEQRLRNPLVFTLYVGILNSLAFLLWPFDFSFLDFRTTFLAFTAGVTFLAAIFFFYSAVKKGEISRVVAFVGGVSPIFLFGLSHLFLSERLPVFWLASFFLLVLGGLILAFERSGVNFFYSFFASLFFAVTFFCTKMVFTGTTFINGFVWIRAGTVFAAVLIFFFFLLRKFRFGGYVKIPKETLFLFAGNKALGALSFGVLNYAIMLGPVALINALQGTEYVFIFLIVLFFTYFRPDFVRESFTFEKSAQKILGIILVSAGAFVLFFF
ncbi:MAG: hypothetical protein COT67_03060 [Candidatus Tagabacteria bacterium CG09_land_8_20_14_0_10_41_14]|uniref:EamA domain-containing protein n=2 Tax=Candidatus Tagaibacteriota TaxID=1817918 RepID=A0A2H0WKN8_9BACT|nr:MAG: hypothetical protein COT67_03060 [Candidatus Tagabacteria bacterium CG09_land_8_20_14_0_10_41_14]PJE73071.1 MAG: hypothetical protein COV00_01875 [Candidatus Tagabacteria bacterium CG10_big_fil_rev_8_21_14_0_10_40_13]